MMVEEKKPKRELIIWLITILSTFIWMLLIWVVFRNIAPYNLFHIEILLIIPLLLLFLWRIRKKGKRKLYTLFLVFLFLAISSNCLYSFVLIARPIW